MKSTMQIVEDLEETTENVLETLQYDLDNGDDDHCTLAGSIRVLRDKCNELLLELGAR